MIGGGINPAGQNGSIDSYFLPGYLITLSRPIFSRLPFWPAGFILPPFIENLLIYFFQYGSFGGGVNNGCS